MAASREDLIRIVEQSNGGTAEELKAWTHYELLTKAQEILRTRSSGGEISHAPIGVATTRLRRDVVGTEKSHQNMIITASALLGAAVTPLKPPSNDHILAMTSFASTTRSGTHQAHPAAQPTSHPVALATAAAAARSSKATSGQVQKVRDHPMPPTSTPSAIPPQPESQQQQQQHLLAALESQINAHSQSHLIQMALQNHPDLARDVQALDKALQAAAQHVLHAVLRPGLFDEDERKLWQAEVQIQIQPQVAHVRACHDQWLRTLAHIVQERDVDLQQLQQRNQPLTTTATTTPTPTNPSIFWTHAQAKQQALKKLLELEMHRSLLLRSLS